MRLTKEYIANDFLHGIASRCEGMGDVLRSYKVDSWCGTDRGLTLLRGFKMGWVGWRMGAPQRSRSGKPPRPEISESRRIVKVSGGYMCMARV